MTLLEAAGFQFDWSVVTTRWQGFVFGAWLDVWIAIVGFLLACLLGLVIALLRLSGVRAATVPSFLFIQLVRGIPIYVMLVWIYFGLATVFKFNLTAIQAMIATLALTGSGYTAETFRAGIEAVDRGQYEAAASLGMNPWLRYRRIILPQALRVVVPPLGNTFIGLLKGATIISVIAVPDMVFFAQELNVTLFTPFEVFTAVALILIVLVLVFSGLVYLLERSLRLR